MIEDYKRLYMLAPNGRSYSCWKMCTNAYPEVETKLKSIIKTACRNGIDTDLVRMAKDELDEKDMQEGRVPCLWTVKWCNRDAVRIIVSHSDGHTNEIEFSLI